MWDSDFSNLWTHMPEENLPSNYNAEDPGKEDKLCSLQNNNNNKKNPKIKQKQQQQQKQNKKTPLAQSTLYFYTGNFQNMVVWLKICIFLSVP